MNLREEPVDEIAGSAPVFDVARRQEDLGDRGQGLVEHVGHGVLVDSRPAGPSQCGDPVALLQVQVGLERLGCGHQRLAARFQQVAHHQLGAAAGPVQVALRQLGVGDGDGGVDDDCRRHDEAVFEHLAEMGDRVVQLGPV